MAFCMQYECIINTYSMLKHTVLSECFSVYLSRGSLLQYFQCMAVWGGRWGAIDGLHVYVHQGNKYFYNFTETKTEIFIPLPPLPKSISPSLYLCASLCLSHKSTSSTPLNLPLFSFTPVFQQKFYSNSFLYTSRMCGQHIRLTILCAFFVCSLLFRLRRTYECVYTNQERSRKQRKLGT